MPTTVIGIDPGLKSTGIGIVKGDQRQVFSFCYGVVNTSQTQPLPERLSKIYEGVYSLLEKEKPTVMIIEDAFSLMKYPKSGISLGKVMGVVELAGQKHGLSIYEVPVREAKKILTGNGKADKAQLEKGVRQFLKTDRPISPSHASDALALALIGLFRYHCA